MPPPKLVRKKSFDRTVTKKCPKCEEKVPVACRYCPCGHQFSSKKLNPSSPGNSQYKRTTTRLSTSGSDNIQPLSIATRRTKRTSRERPDYFNSLVLENQAKQARRKREPSQSSTTSDPPAPPVSPKKRRGRPKGTPNKEKEKDGKMKPTNSKPTNKTPVKEKEEDEVVDTVETPVQEEDLYSNLSAEKSWQLSMILADLNRKFTSTTFNPV